MNSFKRYSVQIIKDEHSLTEAFGLRYRTYQTAFPAIITGLQQPYEHDCYDKRSIHLGLFCEQTGQRMLAGYCRFILPPASSEAFSHLTVKHPWYTAGHSPVTEKLAFIPHLPDKKNRDAIHHFCRQLETTHRLYTETSRFIICDAHRNAVLSWFFVAGMLSVLEILNIGHCFFACAHHHVPFYQKFNLTLFPGIAPFDSSTYGNQCVIFCTDLLSLSTRPKTLSQLVA